MKLILMSVGTGGSWSKGMKQSTLGGQDLKGEGYTRSNMVWRPGRGIIFDPLV